MKERFPQFQSYIAERRFFFSGILQPAPDMPEYKVRIEFRDNKAPRVKVIEPKLVDTPPHFYDKIKCLCLYKPEDFQWTASTLISEYIVPWTSCWLYFYEYWLLDGNWYGPEAKHDKNKPKISS